MGHHRNAFPAARSLVFFCGALAFACRMAGAQPAPAGPPDPSRVKASSLIALGEARMPDAGKLRSALQSRLGSPGVDTIDSDGKRALRIRMGNTIVAVSLLDQPLSREAVAAACRWTWYWRTACEDMAPHKAHLQVVTLDDDRSKVSAALLQTRVVAALMDQPNTVASLWGSSLHSRDEFIQEDAKASAGRLPVWLWIEFRLSRDPAKGWSISTRGMEQFDLQEIESRDVPGEAPKLLNLAAGTAEYLVSKGPVIKDGDTVGDAPAENIRVRRAPSYWREGKTAYRIVFPPGSGAGR